MTGDVEHDGTLEWYDYYDGDKIEVFNWQQVPTVQPDEPGVSCTSIHYYGYVKIRSKKVTILGSATRKTD